MIPKRSFLQKGTTLFDITKWSSYELPFDSQKSGSYCNVRPPVILSIWFHIKLYKSDIYKGGLDYES